MSGEFSDQKCPRCGSPLLTDGKRVWCSFVGGESKTSAKIAPCTYGLETAIIPARTALKEQPPHV